MIAISTATEFNQSAGYPKTVDKQQSGVDAKKNAKKLFTLFGMSIF
jgi:hypothetical protein